MSTARKVNGCPVLLEQNGCVVIKHPLGFMIYEGGRRVATLKTLAGAKRRIERAFR